MKMLKKASPKTIVGEAIRAPEKGSGPVDLFTIWGKANRLLRGESTYGPWVALVGEFEGVNADGEEFASPKAFLPEPLHSMIAERLSDADSTESVEFAVRVSIIPSDSTVGYEYQAEPLIEPAKSDSLSHLRKVAIEAPRRVEASKQDEKPKAKAKATA